MPGLGGVYDPLRSALLKVWRISGVTTELVPMNWRDSRENYEQKVVRLRKSIDQSNRKSIVLVGESAGGSMVVAETSRNESITRCITICGKNQYAARVSPSLYRKNPAFEDSMVASDAAIPILTTNDKDRITTLYTPLDAVVPPIDTLIKGTRRRVIPSFGHLITIFLTLALFWPVVIYEAARR